MVNKYHSKKTIVNGIPFDSKKEANRYGELVLLERSGLITDLKRQVKYELIPSLKWEGKTVERPCSYVADFVYKDEHGRTVVEDTKGFKTNDYIIKRKLMLFLHHIRIHEI